MINGLKNKTHHFLIWSQKYTKTDNVYLAKGGFWLTLEQVVLMMAAILLAIAFANLLSPTIYGNYKYIISLVEILAVFALAGMKPAIIQATARGLEGSFYTGFKTKLKWCLLGSLAAIGGAIYYLIQGNYYLSVPLLISAIFLPLMQASRVYGSFLAGRKLFNIGAQYGIATQTIFVIVMIATLFLTKNLFWLIAVYFASNTFLNYFFYLRTKFKFRPNKKEDPKSISYAKHLSFIGVIGRVTGHIDKVLLFTFIGPIEVAVYSFAILIPNQIISILANINSLAFPKLAVKSQEEIRKNLMKKVWQLSFLTVAIIVIYVLIAPFVYKIIFPQYIASIPYSQLFILSLITLPVSLLTTVFQAKMMKKELYLLKTTGIIQLILLFSLVPLYGILGAILALLGTKVFRVILLFSLFYFSIQKQKAVS